MKNTFGGAIVILVACSGSGNVADGGSDAPNGNDAVAQNDANTTDAANDVTDSGGDSGTFDVGSVSGLALWLAADVSSSVTTSTDDAGVATVLAWKDQTTHQNNASGSTNVGMRNPTLKASAINSLPAIHFDQGTGSVQANGEMLTILNNTDNSLAWGTGDFYVAIVGDFDNDPTKSASAGTGNFFAHNAQTGSIGSPQGVAFYGNVPPGNDIFTSGTANAAAGLDFLTANSPNDFAMTSTAYNDSTAHVFAIRRRGSALDILVDGSSVANATSTTNVDVTSTSNVRIGADGDANLARLDGDIAEIIAVKDVLLPSDEASIEAYLKNKYATP